MFTTSYHKIIIHESVLKVEDFITLTVVPLDGMALTEAMHSRFVEGFTIYPYCRILIVMRLL